MNNRTRRNLGEVMNSFIYGCLNGTDTGCPNPTLLPEGEDVLEKEFAYGLRLWHVIFLSAGAVMAVIILICCCIKFRIPRTKQEIEGDYIRRKILKKFRARLKAIQNQELDEMDLKRALDKIRAEFKSDSESLAQSEALSVATISSSGFGNPHSSTYRRASQIAMDISLEDLRAQTLGCGGRMSYTLSRCCSRSRRARVSQTEPKLIPKDTTVKPGKEEKPVEIPGSSKAAQKHSKSKHATIEVAVIDETSKKQKPKPQQPTVHSSKGEKKSEKVPEGGAKGGGAGDKKSDKGDNKEDKKKSKEKEKAGKTEDTVESKQTKETKAAKQGKDKSKEDKEKVKQEIKEKKEKEKEEKAKREREKIERDKLEKERKQKEKVEKEKAKLEKQKQEKEAKKDKTKK